MPVGTGVRVDTSLRVGDTLDPAADRHIATISSWGRDRPQALARLARALERTGVILSGGPTNRPLLLALVRHPDVLAGPLASGWLNEALTAGKLTPPPDPMALVAAAVEVYDAVERATGVRPPLPPHLADLYDLPEHVTVLPNDLAAVQQFVATTFR